MSHPVIHMVTNFWDLRSLRQLHTIPLKVFSPLTTWKSQTVWLQHYGKLPRTCHTEKNRQTKTFILCSDLPYINYSCLKPWREYRTGGVYTRDLVLHGCLTKSHEVKQRIILSSLGKLWHEVIVLYWYSKQQIRKWTDSTKVSIKHRVLSL